MDLFNDLESEPINILSQDGTVNYYGIAIPYSEANQYLNLLLHSIEWKHDEVIVLGNRITTKRKVAFYADNLFNYTYSNTTKVALAWTPELLALKKIIERITDETFNSCLLNLYHNGDEGMAWHSDNDPDLKQNAAIASLSLGDARKFSFKHKQLKETTSLALRHGSLLVMKNETQHYWLHSLPPTKKSDDIRINLTFRTIVN